LLNWEIALHSALSSLSTYVALRVHIPR
jgi:hypothetical protein